MLRNLSLISACLVCVFTTSSVFASYYSSVLADNPVGYYRMNETIASGDLVSSSTGDGAIYNSASGLPVAAGQWFTSYATGGLDEIAGAIPGDAAVFYNTGRTEARTNTAATGLGFTMEAWVMVDGENGDLGGMAMAMREAGNTIGDMFEIGMVGGVAQAFIRNGYGTSSPAGTTVINDGQWHHLAMVVQAGTTNTSRMTLYLDGGVTPEFDVEVSQGWNGVADSLTIGANSFGIRYTGGIDEVALYDTVLSQEQIAAHYNAVPEPASFGLLAIGSVLLAARRR